MKVKRPILARVADSSVFGSLGGLLGRANFQGAGTSCQGVGCGPFGVEVNPGAPGGSSRLDLSPFGELSGPWLLSTLREWWKTFALVIRCRSSLNGGLHFPFRG